MATGRLQRVALRSLLIWAPLCAAAFPLAASAQQAAAVQPAKAAAPAPESALKGDRARTKFIIGLERHVEVQVFSLTNPNRVFVELPDVLFQLPPHPGEGAAGLVKSFRGGVSAPGKVRVVIDVTGPVIVEKAAVEKGTDGAPHLVLEIVPAESVVDARLANARRALMQAGAAALGAGGLQPPIPRPAVSPQARALSMYKPVIVIDPGHGGHDSGAQRNGTVEKSVVLAFSLMLRDKLNATGRYKVLMTRDTDVFIELSKRREFAERNLAQLFVAVHADYYANARARGATIYSLRESVASSLQRSARGEVSDNVLSDKELAAAKPMDGDIGAIRGFLADLIRLEVDRNRDRTSVFVKSVIEYMGESTNLKDNPDRTAAFAVIRSAKVPSILVELAYVSNEQDAEQLKSEVWRDKVSASIVTAIDNYFSHQLARLPM